MLKQEVQEIALNVSILCYGTKHLKREEGQHWKVALRMCPEGMCIEVASMKNFA